MNNQYPASPTPGQPDPNWGDHWQMGQDQNYFAQQGSGQGDNPNYFANAHNNAGKQTPGGDAFGSGSSGIFGRGSAPSGPFSDGGTTSFFGAGGQPDRSAWGSPVPNANAGSGNQGYGNSGHGGGYGGGNPLPPAGGSYNNYNNYNAMSSRNRSSIRVVVGVVIALVLLGVGIFFGFRGVGNDGDPKPSVGSSESANPTPSPTQESSGTAAPNSSAPEEEPNPSGNINGQNADGSVTVGAWKVEKLEFLPDATQQLANISTPVEVKPGHHFAGIKMRFTNTGTEAATPAFGVGITVYFDGGDREWEEMSIREADAVQGLEPIQPGEIVDGWFYVQVPDGYTGGELGFFDYEGSANVDSDLTLP